MPRFFKLSEAEALLPRVEPAIREAIFLMQEHSAADQKLKQETQRIMMLGGADINREEMAQQRARREASAVALAAAVEKIHDLGCQVKDLQMGLVDFPSLYRNEEVLLCWKLGESSITYWHGLQEGFRGRKPIDQDFLDHHMGDRAN